MADRKVELFNKVNGAMKSIEGNLDEIEPKLRELPSEAGAQQRFLTRQVYPSVTALLAARTTLRDGLEELETFLRATNIGQRPKLEVEEFVISKKSDSGVLDERIRARLQGVPRNTGDPVTHLIQFIGVR